MTPSGQRRPGPNYWDYLRLDQLLSAQGGVEGDENAITNHELLFIVVHQVYELWFKQMLRELEGVRDLLDRDPVPDQDLSLAVSSLRRVREILDHCTSHFRVMETLSPRDFLDFRDKLVPASGFQSGQLREMEILLGLPADKRIHLGKEGSYLDALRSHDGEESHALRRVRARLDDPRSLAAVVEDWLYRTPIRGSDPSTPGDAEAVRKFVEDYLGVLGSELGDFSVMAERQADADVDRDRLRARYEAEVAGARKFLLAEDVPVLDDPSARLRRSRIRAALVFIESYRSAPLLAWPRELLEATIAMEQAFILFRQRHARMVEREIGRRTGTGGSSGVEYLDRTALEYRVFGDLWAVRTILIRRGAVPDLENARFYGFRFDGA